MMCRFYINDTEGTEVLGFCGEGPRNKLKGNWGNNYRLVSLLVSASSRHGMHGSKREL